MREKLGWSTGLGYVAGFRAALRLDGGNLDSPSVIARARAGKRLLVPGP